MFKVFKTVYNRIRGNEDSGNLIANFGYLSLLQIAGYLFPLLTLPYLAKTIGTVGFGNIAFASAVVTWLLSIVTWGFDYTATRDVARNRSNPKEVSIIFSNVIWTRLFLTCLSFVFLLILIFTLPKFYENRIVLFVTFLMIPGHVMFPEWMFQALERMKYITFLSLFSKFLFTLLVFVFIKNPDDFILQPLFISLGYFVSGIISLYFIIIKWKYRVLRPSYAMIASTIRGSADVFVNNFMPNLYNSMSFVLLGTFHGSSANGILSAGSRCLNISIQFMSVLSRVFFPFLSRRIDKHKTYARISISVAFVFSLFLYFFASMFIKIFYTEDFNDAVLLAKILSPSLIFLAISNVYGTNFLILNGHEKILRNITIFFSFLGLFIAIPFIYLWGTIGAAITITLIRGLLGVSTMYYSQKVKTYK